jgi:hypothetical protein
MFTTNVGEKEVVRCDQLDELQGYLTLCLNGMYLIVIRNAESLYL